MTHKIWFITGASRGFGREWAEAALERGDSVAATARDLSALADLAETYGERLLPLRLDVTDRDADFAAVRQAHEHFGRLDVVVNNAGYGHFGMVEELTEAEARAQLETNLFGALWVTQAALPYLREQGGGHILQVSSIGGISAFPLVGIYHASKWALEGMSQSLAQEVAPFGIKVTLIEPGGFATDWCGFLVEAPPSRCPRTRRPRGQEQRRKRAGTPGDPAASAAAMLDVVDAEQPPLRCFFGSAPLGIAKADYEQRLASGRVAAGRRTGARGLTGHLTRHLVPHGTGRTRSSTPTGVEDPVRRPEAGGQRPVHGRGVVGPRGLAGELDTSGGGAEQVVVVGGRPEVQVRVRAAREGVGRPAGDPDRVRRRHVRPYIQRSPAMPSATTSWSVRASSRRAPSPPTRAASTGSPITRDMSYQECQSVPAVPC